MNQRVQVCSQAHNENSVTLLDYVYSPHPHSLSSIEFLDYYRSIMVDRSPIFNCLYSYTSTVVYVLRMQMNIRRMQQRP